MHKRVLFLLMLSFALLSTTHGDAKIKEGLPSGMIEPEKSSRECAEQYLSPKFLDKYTHSIEWRYDWLCEVGPKLRFYLIDTKSVKEFIEETGKYFHELIEEGEKGESEEKK